MTMIASSNREIERNHGTDQEIKGWNQAISQWFNILSGHGFNNFLSFFLFFFSIFMKYYLKHVSKQHYSPRDKW